MTNKISYILLGSIGLILFLSYMQNCSERKDMDSYFKKELDSLKAQVENLTQLANARRDTIIENYRYITKIVNEAEILKEEIRLTEIMDSVVGNYKKHHPGTAEIKVTSDSTAEISKREVKFVTEQFVDLKILKEVNAKDIEQFGLYERALADKDEIIGIQEKEIRLLKDQVELLMPSWYDKFYIGFGSAILIVTTIILVL